MSWPGSDVRQEASRPKALEPFSLRRSGELGEIDPFMLQKVFGERLSENTLKGMQGVEAMIPQSLPLLRSENVLA
jgi:hypothetical protein